MSRRSENLVPWVEDPRLEILKECLSSSITQPREVLRVVGLSGIGKSRLCLEALSRLDKDEVTSRVLRDFVMYTAQSEVGVQAIIATVEKLAISGGRAVVVVDDCDPLTHAKLDKIVSRPDSDVSLITIHDEIPERINANTIKINKALEKVIKPIIDSIANTMPSVDRNRLARLSDGFPEVAIRIARELAMGQHFIDPADGALIDKYVCGRSEKDHELLLNSAQLLAAFGLIRIEPADEDRLLKIAPLSRQLTHDDIHAVIQGLIQRDVAKLKGGFVTLEPRSIAVRLAERQWREWGQRKWDQVLTGNIGYELNISAARRLSELNTEEISKRVVSYVLRANGPFDKIDSIHLPGRAEVLLALAMIDPYAVAEYTTHYFDRLGDLRQLEEHVHRILVRMSSKIAFHSESFKIGARLLLRLENAKPQSWIPDNSRHFAKLFSPVLGGTEADGVTRLLFLDGVISSSDTEQMYYIIDALVEGCTPGMYSRLVEAEIQGSLRALNSWHPASKQEWSEYIAGCVERLGKIAIRNDNVGEKARSELSYLIWPLIHKGFLESVEDLITQVINAGHSWTIPLRQLKAAISQNSDSIDKKIHPRIMALIDKLEPTHLRERVRVYISDPPMAVPSGKEWSEPQRINHHRTVVQELVRELLEDSQTLAEILYEVSQGKHFMAYELGKALAECSPYPLTWLEPIVQALNDVHKPDRNYDLLSGFVLGLQENFREEVEEFKAKAVASPELAQAFAMVCRRADLTSEDIDCAIDAFNEGTLSPQDLYCWAFIRFFKNVPAAKISLFLDTLLNDDGIPAFALAVTILGQILAGEEFNNRSSKWNLNVDDFEPQLLKAVNSAGCWSGKKPNLLPQEETMIKYDFGKIVEWVLKRGRTDSNARKASLELARILVNEDHDTWHDSGLIETSALSIMLSDFPEIVWPIIGGTIVKNPRFANRMRSIVGQPYIKELDFTPPILDIPEDNLFSWCHANPDAAPAFLARCAPLLFPEVEDKQNEEFHPVITRLLDEFGERDDVQTILGNRIHTYSGVSSLGNYYARFKKTFNDLEAHKKPEVRQWAEKMYREMVRYSNRGRFEDQEWEMLKF